MQRRTYPQANGSLAYNVLMIDTDTFDALVHPLEPWWFLRPYTIHGLSHTRRVLIHAAALAGPAGLTYIEFGALIHAVTWHDIGRTHDGVEPEHGRQSLARIDDLNLSCDLSPETLEPMRFAIEWHSLDDEAASEAAAHTTPRFPAGGLDSRTSTGPAANLDSRLRVLWTLKDADGLDRVRIHDLDVSRLRSDAAKARKAEAWRLLEEMP